MKFKLFQRKKLAFALYAVALVLFFIFFLSIAVFDDVSISRTRDPMEHSILRSFTQETVAQDVAPAGVQHYYRWTAEQVSDGEYLCFYVNYSSVEVYIGQELIYWLTSHAGNLFSQGVGSNWVSVPLSPADEGQTVTVVVTPYYRAANDPHIDFIVGSRYTLLMEQLKHDCVDIILSVICIFMGLFISISHIHQRRKHISTSLSMFCLANFSIFLGCWHLTDIRVAAILFSGQPLLLNYISLGSLSLCVTPLLLFLREEMLDTDRAPLFLLALVSSGAAIVMLLCQVLGIAELRQTLFICHIIIVLCSMSALVVIFYHLRHKAALPASARYSFLLAIGLIADLINYYVTDGQHELIFTIPFFLLYLLLLFSRNNAETSKRIYTDVLTGLYNRTRWDELMRVKTISAPSLAIVMMDLNGLKQANDELGHGEGDRMLFLFANILRNTAPADSTICRWGGDEFGIMLTNATDAGTQRLIAAIRRKCDDYNRSAPAPHLSFSAGYALASEFPELSRKQLWARADERMYEEKLHWHNT